MSSLTDRPFAGTWTGNRPVSRVVPDCLVYINGLTTLPGCPSCNGQIDIQKYVTQVSVEPNTEPIASATISMSIPAFAGEYFFRDGDFLLRPGLEVVIYMRGRYADSTLLTAKDSVNLNEVTTGLETDAGLASEVTGNTSGTTFDPTGIPVNPYYQVFHGVVTEASHEYSAGEYTASVSCNDVLHFWQNLKISTNGAVFGPRPDGSGVAPTLQGHTFQGASPYSIIYTLYRVGFGASGAVEYNLEQETNVSANSEVSGQTHYKAAALWWEKRWASDSIRLMMYGADGSLYNAFTQAYLGIFSGKNPEQLKALLGKGKTDSKAFSATSDKTLAKLARDLGYNPLSTQVSVAVGAGGNVSRTDTLKQQAFCLDISTLGNVNIFETEYLSKLEIANAVRTITGFEFYQDVTGNLVFKPPFYNMDTSSDPNYVIDDGDLISISQSEREPEATYIKGTGSHFQNTKGVGLDGWLGMNSTYIDFRLVAQFGWREAEFESSYVSDTRALFVLAMNRLDLVNVGCKSASITIPLRPELRPGYPVYVVYLDCFYYVQSLSHSFQFGGQCTTTINGVAKRAKFNAPGVVPGDRTPNIGDIHLENPYLPSLPLTLRADEIEGQNQEGGPSGPPRIMGFPNVVLALDPKTINAGALLYIERLPLDQIIQYALSCGELKISVEAEGTTEAERRLNGPWVLASATSQGLVVTRTYLQTQWSSVQQALTAKQTLETIAENNLLAQLISNVKRKQGLTTDDQSLLNYLVLTHDAKAAFGVSNNIVGTYRYFSCSHPSPEHQGTSNLTLTAGERPISTTSPQADTTDPFGGTWLKEHLARVAAYAPTDTKPVSDGSGEADPVEAEPAQLDAPAENFGFTFAPPAPPATTATSGTGTLTGGADASSLKSLSDNEVYDYYTQVMQGVGIADTANNRAFFAAWATQEGGSGGTKALYNPLNTTWNKSGATAFNYNNGNPVKNYTSYDDGVSATVKTLRQGYYTPIVNAMQDGTKTPQEIINSPGVKASLDTWGSTGTGVASVISSGVTTPPAIWGGDAQAWGRNVGESPVTEGDVVSTDGATPTNLETVGFTNGTGIKYGTLRPTAGMKVLQFDVAPRDSSDPLAVSVPEKTVPTSEIQFVTFASHSLSLSTLSVNGADGKNYGANLTQPPQASMTDLFKGYMLRATGATPDESVTERYGSAYADLIDDIANTLYDNDTRSYPKSLLQSTAYPPNPAASYYAYLQAAREQYKQLSFTLKEVKAANGNALDLSATVLANFTGTNAPQATAESRGTKAICGTLGQGAATFYTTVLTALQDAAKKKVDEGTYDADKMKSVYEQLYAARNAYLQDYASALGVPFTPPVDAAGEVKITFPKYTGTNTYTPVFPVSDARGYEVIGAQRYGRGLTAATYAQVMQSTRDVSSEGLTLSSRAIIGDISTDATTFQAIEDFYIALADDGIDGNVSKAFAKLGATQQQAVLTAAADIATTSDGAAPTTINPTLLSNFATQSGNYGQQFQYASNVPARLADISASTTANPVPCSCKISDAQSYLLASTGEYVQLETEAEVNDFLLDEASLKTKTWQQARDAMAGQALDPAYSSLAEQFVNAVTSGNK